MDKELTDEDVSAPILNAAFREAGLSHPFYGEAFQPGVIIQSIVRQVSALRQSEAREPSEAVVERVARALAETCCVDLSVAIGEAGGITNAVDLFGMTEHSDDPRYKDWRIPSCRGIVKSAKAAALAAHDGEGLLAIADYLIDQRDEPWPEISNSDRLHYWRDKAIEAANRIRAHLSRVTGQDRG